MANGTTNDAAKHVATPFISGANPVGEEEGDSTGVIRNDLIAKALRLKLLCAVAGDLAQCGVDWHEEIGVVIGEHLLTDARKSLKAHPCVNTLEGELGAAPISVLFVLHKDEVPDLQPARALLRVVRRTVAPTGELSTTIKMDL